MIIRTIPFNSTFLEDFNRIKKDIEDVYFKDFGNLDKYLDSSMKQSVFKNVNKENVTFTFLTPGVDKENLNVEIKENFLHVSGKSKEPNLTLEVNHTISLKEFNELNIDNTKLSYKDGLLKVEIPFKEKDKEVTSKKFKL